MAPAEMLRAAVLALVLALALVAAPVSADSRDTCTSHDDCVTSSDGIYCVDVGGSMRCAECQPNAPPSEGGVFRDCPGGSFCVGSNGKSLEGLEDYNDELIGECAKVREPLGEQCNPAATGAHVNENDETVSDANFCGLVQMEGDTPTYQWTGVCVKKTCELCHAHQPIGSGLHKKCVNRGFSGSGGTIVTARRVGNADEINQHYGLQILLLLTFITIATLGITCAVFWDKRGVLPSFK